MYSYVWYLLIHLHRQINAIPFHSIPYITFAWPVINKKKWKTKLKDFEKK